MRKHLLLVISFLIILNFTNCKNDDVAENPTENPDMNQGENPNPITLNYDFGNDVNRNFIGRVVNEDNQPLAAATITIGNETTQTDLNGMFVMNNVLVKENFAYIKASLVGYFNGSKSIIPLDGENVINIMLKERFSVIREAGEAFTLEYDEYAIGFSGEFVKEDGSSYSGPVTIAFNYLSPSDENLNELMPGMLLGQDMDDEANLLETYGMLTVELTGSANEKLQIASDSELKFPIADEQLANAPDTIPLWYFDEDHGYWIEDGEATKVGNQYVGTVSHFTTWNDSVSYSNTKIDITVLNQNNDPLVGIDVYAYIQGVSSYPIILTTNQDGKASDFVYANTSMTLEVKGHCEETITTLNVSPIPQGSTSIIPPIVITETIAPQSEIQGTLKQCDNVNVTNGYVILTRNDSDPVFYSISDGDFEFSTLICQGETSFSLEGYDVNNFQSTGENNYSFATPITDVGDLMTCNNVDEYIAYSLDISTTNFSLSEQRLVLAPFHASIEPNRLYIEKTSEEEFIMDFNPFEGEQFINTTTYEADNDFIFKHDFGQSPTLNWRSYGSIPVSVNEMTLSFSEIGEIGEYITFTFEGRHVEIDDSNIWTEIVSGTARVRRNE